MDDIMKYLDSHPAVSCLILVFVLGAAGLADWTRRTIMKKKVGAIRCQRCNYVGAPKIRLLQPLKPVCPKCEGDNWVSESPVKMP
ncbi:MAG: hypothetical protein ACLQNE_08200 [Thermoguttaceae bacterium]